MIRIVVRLVLMVFDMLSGHSRFMLAAGLCQRPGRLE